MVVIHRVYLCKKHGGFEGGYHHQDAFILFTKHELDTW